MAEPAYIGIDPGMSGALALWRPADDLLYVIDMPVHEVNGKNRIDLYNLGDQILGWRGAAAIARATIENVTAMPPISRPGKPQRSAGVASSFAFGFSAGAVQATVATLDIPMVLVVPQVWKKAYGLRGGAEHKDESRQKASMIFPKHAALWTRKKDNGRAEAALLAHYGSKMP